MTTQLNILDLIAEGELLKQQGIERAINGAGDEFKQKAIAYAIEYVSKLKVGQTFKVEDIRISASLSDQVPKPKKSNRAWVCIMKPLEDCKIMQRVGDARTVNPNTHGARCTLWMRV